MPRESRSGPRSGIPLSHCTWVAKPGAFESTYEGSLNEFLLGFFRRPCRLVDMMPKIVAAYEAKKLPPLKQPVRSYLSMRLYELRRRDLFIIREPA